MGNRAVVTFAKKSEVEKYIVPAEKGGNGEKLDGFVADNPNRVGVYLHWNGGRDSIVPFCKACREIGFRCPTDDFSYGVARFVQLVANFFGGCDDCSIGVDTLCNLDCDNYDNGVFIVGEGWEIIGREFSYGDPSLDEGKVKGFVNYLVDTQKGIDKLKDELDNKKGK